MKNILSDSSEIREAVELFNEFVEKAPEKKVEKRVEKEYKVMPDIPAGKKVILSTITDNDKPEDTKILPKSPYVINTQTSAPPAQQESSKRKSGFKIKTDSPWPEFNEAFKTVEIHAPQAPKRIKPERKASPVIVSGSHLETILESMCRSGKFNGSVLADRNGLPVAVYKSPVESDFLAPFTIVLDECIEKSSRFINRYNADNISMDINDLDKIVVKKFIAGNKLYFLMIICSQHVNQRPALVNAIAEIVPLLET